MSDLSIKKVLEDRGLARLQVIEHEDNEISHYGIKGQRWGRRRSRKQLAKAKKARGDAGKLQSQVKKMSNEELKSQVDRLNLEKRYLDLAKQTAKPPTRVQRGQKAVGEILKQSATSAAKTHTTSIMTKGITSGIQKKYPDYKLGGKKKK